MKFLYTLFLATVTYCISAQSYTSATIVSGLQYPIAFDTAPDGRFFITEKGDGSNTAGQKSRIRVYAANGTAIGTFYDLSDSTNSDGERGVLGIELDPDFSTNHFVYVYYNHRYNGDERIRIIRLTESSNAGTNPAIIFDLDVANNIAGNHLGGNLHFRPSQPNHIYFTLGDLGDNQTNPTLNYANKLTNPYGKVLRILKTGAVPTDNPYYDDGDPLSGSCDWIWSYGHRNPFDFCFSTMNDSLYCSENGLFTWDEVNLIHKGGNYGWAACEGSYANSSTVTPCPDPNSILPIASWGSPVPALTGVLFYSGNTWAALTNHLLVADNNNGRIYDCTLGNAPYYNTITTYTTLGDVTTGGLTTLRQSNDGCIYAMQGGYTTNGKIFKLCPVASGINENEHLLSVKLYPNPAKHSVNIKISAIYSEPVIIELSDIYGRIVETKTALMNNGQTFSSLSIESETYNKGIYFVTLKNASTQQFLASQKLMIE